MSTVKILLFGAIAVAALISRGYASPCSERIDNMEVRINEKLAAYASAGPAGRQGRAAGMSVQPTPRSMAAAEEKLGDISAQSVDAIMKAMSRARASESAGDQSGCERALSDAERALAQ